MTTLLLIDLSAIYWTCWHASANEELSAAFEKTLTAARRLIESEKADHVAIACDFPPYKRKALLPAYKANREAAPPLATEQLRKVEQRLRDDGLTVWSVPGYEADDIIATAAHVAVAKDMRVVIASGDKDLLQCVGPGVVAVSPATSNRYDVTGVQDRMGVPPPLVGDLLALTGDKSDNIPGITGCGPKTAAGWLASYGSLEGVISNAKELGRFAGVVEEKAEEIRLWRRVVELDRGVPIRFEELFEEKEVRPLVKSDYEEGFGDEQALDAVTGGVGPGGTSAATPANLGMSGPNLEAAEHGQRADLSLELPPPPRVEQAIVRHQPTQTGIGSLQPRDPSAAWKLAGALFNSRLYQQFKTQEQVFAVMIRGSELGIGVTTALDCMHVIQGRPTMHAHLIIARAMAHPKCEYFRLVESSAEKAIYETKHLDYPEPTRLTYTIAEARLARGRDFAGNWTTRPAEMLRKSCGTLLTRIVYPDAALGLYATEELSDE